MSVYISVYRFRGSVLFHTHKICPGQESKGDEEHSVGPNPSVDTHTAWRYVGQGAERCGQSWETLVCRWIEDKGELHTSPAACRRRCYLPSPGLAGMETNAVGNSFLPCTNLRGCP